MLQIRKIKPEDLEFIFELAEKSGWQREKLSANLEGFLVCELDGVKCGCGCLIKNEGIGILDWIKVIEGFRGRRLGEAIVKALLNVADRSMIKDVYAVIPEEASGTSCEKFLSALGFRAVEAAAEGGKIMKMLGETGRKCYHVSLEGYFKPCSEK